MNVMEWLLRPRLLFLVRRGEEDVSLDPYRIALRIAVGLITAAWIGFLPLYLFVIYMHQNHFFSYDFFVEGIFGLNTFIAATALMLVMISFYFYGFFVFLVLGLRQQIREAKNSYRFAFWFFFAFSLLMHIVIYDLALRSDKPELMIWLMGISAIFCLLASSMARQGFRESLQNWRAPVVFISLSMVMPFLHQDVTSEVVSMSLRSFNIGGGKNFQVFDAAGKPILDQAEKLLLLTPSNAYVKMADGKLMIVPINNRLDVKVW